MKNDLENVALNKYPKLYKLKIFLEKLPKVEFVRMTGSGSAIIAYFLSKKHCRDAEKKLKNNLEITGVKYQKLYKLFFCDMKIILGRSQAVRHGFLVPAS